MTYCIDLRYKSTKLLEKYFWMGQSRLYIIMCKLCLCFFIQVVCNNSNISKTYKDLNTHLTLKCSNQKHVGIFEEISQRISWRRKPRWIKIIRFRARALQLAMSYSRYNIFLIAYLLSSVSNAFDIYNFLIINFTNREYFISLNL